MAFETGIRMCFQRVHQILSSHKIVFGSPKLHLGSSDPEYDSKKPNRCSKKWFSGKWGTFLKMKQNFTTTLLCE